MNANVFPDTLAPIRALTKPGKYDEAFRQTVANMYRGGATLSKIEHEFNLTRGKVAGILKRAGIFAEISRRQPAKPKPPLRGRRIHPPKFNCVPFQEQVAEVVPLHLPFPRERLDQCAFMYGDDPSAMTCCGHPVYGTTSWCEAHLRIVSQPAQPKYREPRPR